MAGDDEKARDQRFTPLFPVDQDEYTRRREAEELKQQDWRRRRDEFLWKHPEAREFIPGASERVATPPIPDLLVQLVLPTAVSAIVTAVVETAISWLRGLRHEPEGEHAVLIYGPNGEPLRKVRRRHNLPEPEIFEHKWPLPPE